MTAINATNENIKARIKGLFFTKPMLAGDIGKAIHYTGRRLSYNVVCVCKELVAEGYLKVADKVYGYERYTRA